MGTQASIKRILIILMGSLGDVARGLALVPILKAARPDFELHWLIEPKWQVVVEAQPGIDRVVVFERHKGVRGAAQLFGKLRHARYDIVLDLQRHAKSGIFSRMTGAPQRIGFARSDSKEFNWIFQTDHIPAVGDSVAKFAQYMSFLSVVGVEVPKEIHTPYLSVPSAPPPPIPNIPYAVFVLGSSWKSKDWPISGYAQAITALLQETSLSLLLVGDKSQVGAAEKLSTLFPQDRVINSVGTTSLGDLLHLLRGAAVCVGPDSGPGHLAAGFGVPTVTMFGPTSALRTAPVGRRARALESRLGCAPCYRRICPGLDTMCMRAHDPRALVNEVLNLIPKACRG